MSMSSEILAANSRVRSSSIVYRWCWCWWVFRCFCVISVSLSSSPAQDRSRVKGSPVSKNANIRNDDSSILFVVVVKVVVLLFRCWNTPTLEHFAKEFSIEISAAIALILINFPSSWLLFLVSTASGFNFRQSSDVSAVQNGGTLICPVRLRLIVD